MVQKRRKGSKLALLDDDLSEDRVLLEEDFNANVTNTNAHYFEDLGDTLGVIAVLSFL